MTRVLTRFICTPKRPWTKADGFPASHTNTQEIGGQENNWPCGDLITIRCKDCGAEWKEELPQ